MLESYLITDYLVITETKKVGVGETFIGSLGEYLREYKEN